MDCAGYDELSYRLGNDAVGDGREAHQPINGKNQVCGLLKIEKELERMLM